MAYCTDASVSILCAKKKNPVELILIDVFSMGNFGRVQPSSLLVIAL
jgi:hypothetical protein